MGGRFVGSCKSVAVVDGGGGRVGEDEHFPKAPCDDVELSAAKTKARG